jgi:hypothetical protein
LALLATSVCTPFAVTAALFTVCCTASVTPCAVSFTSLTSGILWFSFR